MGDLNNVVVRGEISCSNFDEYLAATGAAAARKNTPYHYFQDIAENTKFILGHFQVPLFPRTISTFRSKGKQIKVYAVDEMICEFKKSEYIDCKIAHFH